MIKVYGSKLKELSGSRYADVYGKAYNFYNNIKKKTKRRPYVRSAYFKKSKIFLGLFWSHLKEKKNLRDKTRRVKLFLCAIDLIKNSKFDPMTKNHLTDTSKIVHRFKGMTATGNTFCVQILEDKRSANKWLISVFPYKK